MTEVKTPIEVECNSCHLACKGGRYKSKTKSSLHNPKEISDIYPRFSSHRTNIFREAERYDITICHKCFAEGRYPEEMASSDFIRMEPVYPDATDSWTDQETLLLLEGIEDFGENWEKVAEHVGSKTVEQCVAHFIKIPIEDNYLEDQIHRMSKCSLNHEDLSKEDIPFTNNENPVMSLVTFLTSVINPGVGAAAAKEALAAMTEDSAQSDPTQNSANTTLDASNDTDEKESSGDLEKDAAAEGDKKETSATPKPDQRSLEDIDIRAVMLAALGTAAEKARFLYEKEEKDIQKLMGAAIEAQIKKLERKLKYFDMSDEQLEADRQTVNRERQQIINERIQMKKDKIAAATQPQANANTQM
eukprot:TRINITY_DN4655_c0_g2_i1.p1 TRINITY_DN4655_c0_g2~~TRINITY_DN4655_c0_g2_i1.p1  ORF type:complete len:360 (+),score=131.97 TRINITY_DN4655_c0_g2_i1:202-1281(+)